MGQKDAKGTNLAASRAEQLIADLAPLGDVTAKSMFRGQGVFESGVMFAMVDREGVVRLRADDDTSRALVDAGGHKHDRMPYWSIDDDVRTDPDKLITWAELALEVARKAKGKT